MCAIILASIFGASILIIWKTLTSYLKMVYTALPGPKPRPIVGNALQYKSNDHDFNIQLLELAEKYKEYGLFRLWTGPHLTVIVTRADTAETLLSSTTLITKSFYYEFLYPWLRTGLLTSTGKKWQERRKMLTPSFHYTILKNFVRIFNEQAIVLVNQLHKHLDNSKFDVSGYITRCTLDIICVTAMGKQLNCQTYRNLSYLENVQRMCELFINRTKCPWYWPDLFFKFTRQGNEQAKVLATIHNFTDKVINERRIEFLKNKAEKVQKSSDSSSSANDDTAHVMKNKVAFLDMLLAVEGADKLTNEDIREEVDTFMFEGHDTTASALKWAIFLIGKHKDVQQKLRQELDAIFGNSDREATMEDISDMKYLDAVLKETMRLYPPVPMFARKMTEDCVFNNHRVPKGSTIMVLVQAIHRDPQQFPSPNEFDANRWLNQEQERNPFAFIPFSAGMRNCIGQKFAMMEEKVIISTLIRHYFIETTQNEQDLRPSGQLVLRPEAGVFIQLLARP